MKEEGRKGKNRKVEKRKGGDGRGGRGKEGEKRRKRKENNNKTKSTVYAQPWTCLSFCRKLVEVRIGSEWSQLSTSQLPDPEEETFSF